MDLAEAVTAPSVTLLYLNEHPVKVIAAVSLPAGVPLVIVKVVPEQVNIAAVAVVTITVALLSVLTVQPVITKVSPTAMPPNFEVAEVIVCAPNVISPAGEVKVNESTQANSVAANKALPDVRV